MNKKQNKKRSTLKGTTIKYFRGKLTSTYLDQLKRFEELRLSMEGKRNV
jgi:hypothetical protein